MTEDTKPPCKKIPWWWTGGPIIRPRAEGPETPGRAIPWDGVDRRKAPRDGFSPTVPMVYRDELDIDLSDG
jgi:hypothetical protein